jgi:hypothetical protein
MWDLIQNIDKREQMNLLCYEIDICVSRSLKRMFLETSEMVEKLWFGSIAIGVVFVKRQEFLKERMFNKLCFSKFQSHQIQKRTQRN